MTRLFTPKLDTRSIDTIGKDDRRLVNSRKFNVLLGGEETNSDTPMNLSVTNENLSILLLDRRCELTLFEIGRVDGIPSLLFVIVGELNLDLNGIRWDIGVDDRSVGASERIVDEHSIREREVEGDFG